MQKTSRSKTVRALIIHSKRIGEKDRLVTLITQEFGKQKAVAKSARTIKSRQRASLEPGSVIKTHLITTKSLPIMTQTDLLSDTSSIRSSLPKMRQLQQLFEFYNALLVEEELENALFMNVLAARDSIINQETTSTAILTMIDGILVQLGYQSIADTPHQSLNEYISTLVERPMKSWQFLHI